MKNYINPAEWAELENALKKAQIPYSVRWDSHVSEDFQTVTYDKYIYIEPAILQERVSV
jgi:hypothetical protein